MFYSIWLFFFRLFVTNKALYYIFTVLQYFTKEINTKGLDFRLYWLFRVVYVLFVILNKLGLKGRLHAAGLVGSF